MGTNYARPDDLDDFSRGNRSADGVLRGTASRLHGAYADFRSTCHWGVLDADSLLNALNPQFLSYNEEDARWVETIAKAFRHADADHGLPDAAIAAVLRRAGIGDIRGSVTFTDPVAYGFPPTSGYANDPVNTGTGNFVELEADLPFDGPLATLSFARTYNSCSDRIGAFGRGWSSWSNARLRATETGAEYEGPDGQRALFARNEAGYAEVVGIDALVEPLDSGLALAWFGGERWEFDEDGLPVTIARGPGTAMRLLHDGDDRLVELVHERGKRIDLAWDGERIATATCSDGRSAAFRYDDDANLVAVDRDGATRSYEIGEAGRVVSVTDADGVVEVVNDYDSEGRVIEQLSPFGRRTRFVYLPGRVTVTTDSSDGPPNTYVHDAFGRVTEIIDGDGAGMTFDYDSRGRPVKITERGGAVTLQEWDERGRLLRRVLPAGAELAFAYDDADRLISASNSLGAVTTLRYDGDERAPAEIVDPEGGIERRTVEGGLVRAVTDADGVVERFELDEDGNVVARIDADDNVTRFERDAAGRVTAEVTPLGRRTERSYDGHGHLRERRDPLGNTWHYEHSPGGRLESVTDPVGARRELRYGEHGEREALVDPLGRITAQSFDVFGNVVGVTTPDGAAWEYGYDALMRLTTIGDPLGATWRREFDVDGNLVASVDPTGTRYAATYDRAGQLVGVSDGLTSAEIARDELGRVVGLEYPDGTGLRCSYDLCGRIVSVEDPVGGITRLEYSPAGRLVREVKPSGSVTLSEYDACGRRAARVDGAGRRWEYRYDADGRLVERLDADGGVARMRYDDAGSLVEISEPGRGVTRYEHDAAGRKTAIADRVAGRRTFAYDELGDLASATDANGAVTHYARDERGRVTEVADPLGATATRAYDAVGRLVSATDPLGRTQTHRYDAAGRIVELDDGSGRTTCWSYDVAGRVSSYGPVDGAPIAIERDALGRATSITEPGSFVNELSWDPAGRLVERRRDGLAMHWRYTEDGACAAIGFPDGSETTFTYDGGGLQDGMLHPAVGAIAFQRDAAGRLVGASGEELDARWRYVDGDLVEQQLEVAGSTRSARLERDGAGRVAEAIVDGVEQRFGYDAAGQLVSAQAGGSEAAFSYDAGGRLERERTPAVAEVSYAYDAAGQLLERRGPGDAITAFEYDGAGRRVSANGPDASHSWTWDALGRLTATETGGGGGEAADPRVTRLAVDALGELAELDGEAVMWDTTDPLGPLAWLGAEAVVGHGAPWALAGDGGPNWLAPDWQGTIGGPADPWGAATGGNGAHASHLSFRGELSSDAGLWLRNRIYDPSTRSFLTPDPAPAVPGTAAAANPYHYALNNPIGLSDPLGLRPITDSELQGYRDRMDRSLFDRAGDIVVDGVKWVGDHAGEISAVAGILATICAPFPPLALALGAVSLAAGSYQTYKDVKAGDWAGVGLDVLGMVPGVGAEFRTVQQVGREARAAEILGDVASYTGRDVNVIVDGYKAWSVEDAAIRAHKAWAGVLGWTSNVANVGGVGYAHAHAHE